MYIHRFKNLNVRWEGKDYLANGLAYFVLEEYDDDTKEAIFDKVELYDILDKDGYCTSKEVLSRFADIVQAQLNQDSTLCRSLGSKVY